MTMIEFEYALLFVLVLVVGWLIAGVVRLKRSDAARRRYLELFNSVCDDDKVPLHLIESAQTIFRFSRGYGVSVWLMTFFLRKDQNVKNLAVFSEIETMPQDSAARLADCLTALFVYVSYSAPIIGFLMRNLVINSKGSYSGGNPNDILFVAVDRLSHVS